MEIDRQETADNLRLGGQQPPLLDVADGFWGIRRHLQSLVGKRLSEVVLEQAGAGGGIWLAKELSPDGPARGPRAFRQALAAYCASGFGDFAIRALDWSAADDFSSALIEAKDSFETWSITRRGGKADSPVCLYTSGLLTGLLSHTADRQDIICVEHSCQAKGDRVCLFELKTTDGEVGPALAMGSDASLSQQLGLTEILFSRMPMGIAILDSNLVLQRFNPTWAEQISRYSNTPLSAIRSGKNYFDIVPDTQKIIGPLFDRVMRGETVRREDFRLESTGKVSFWDVAFSPLTEERKVVGLVQITTDATDRVTAYQTLERRVDERTRELTNLLGENARLYAAEQARRREAEQRREVAEAMSDIVRVLNSDRELDDILDYVIDQAIRLHRTDAVALYRFDKREGNLRIVSSRGLPEEYVKEMIIPIGEGAVGKAVLERRPVVVNDLRVFFEGLAPVVPLPARDHLRDLARRYETILAVPLIVKDEVYGSIALYYPKGEPLTPEHVALAATFGDQAALAIENARLREAAEQAAIAAERSRLARDLHDAVTQTLFSASLIAEVLPNIWERDVEGGKKRLLELRDLTRGALAEMRALLLELRPITLAETTLGDLLRQLAAATTGRARLPVEVRIGDIKELDHVTDEVKIALYRIAQEALNNVARHSGATLARVTLTRHHSESQAPSGEAQDEMTGNWADTVELAIGDNGRGFDTSHAFAAEHLGLSIMQERAQSIGAKLEIESDPNHGTEITVWIKTSYLKEPLAPASRRPVNPA